MRLQRTCSITDCLSSHFGKGWCRKHYERWHRHGDPLALLREGSPAVRFWRQVAPANEMGCFIWTGGKSNSDGYGCFYDGVSAVAVHRWAFEQVCLIPEGLELDHICRDRACVNWAHLEPVTHEENIRRGETGRYLRDRTHCPQGHPYDAINTYVNDAGYRACRICVRARARAYGLRKRREARHS